MREANFAFPSQNRACVCITSALYDRRALDTTAALPLLNSLTHLTYLTSTSPRIREILTLDGGLERLLHILRNSSIPRPPPPPPDLYGLSANPAIPASTGLLSPDRAVAYRFSLAFQCVSNVGVRGSEQIRTRVVQAGVLDVVAQVLEVWLRSRGMSTEAGPSGSGQPLNIPGKADTSGARPRRNVAALAAPAAPSAAAEAFAPAAGRPSAQVASALDPDGSLVVLRQTAPGADLTAAASASRLPPSTGAAAHLPPPPPPAGPSLLTRGFATAAANDSRPSSATSEMRHGGSFLNSGDETSVNDGEIEMGDGEDSAPDAAALAASDEETARLAQSASSLLQSMASNTTFVSSRSGIPVEGTPRGGAQLLSSRSPPPPSSRSDRRPSPIRSSSTSTTGTDSELATAPLPLPLRQLDNLSRPALTGNASEASSAGGSNVSTPMGTPTGATMRERSGTLLARPTALAAQQPPPRRRRRERTSTPGNDSTTTGGEDDGGDMMDGEDEDDGQAARQGEGGAGGALVPSASQEVNIVQQEEEDGTTDIEGTMDDTIEGNMDLQMGAPPGAPGAANTPRAAPDMTPRQTFLPMTAVPAGPGIGPSVTSPVALAIEAAPTTTPGGRRGTAPGVMGGMTAPAVAALATAQATQRTLRDLSLEGNTMSPSETTYRDDDILLSLQLLAYLSKYPHVRQAFHKPRQPFHPNLELDEHHTSPLPMRPALSATPNIFSLVERFTFRPSPSDPTTPQLPDEIVYWAGVIMRNACRKDESRGGIRQCANMSCGKWETSPRQFAKCRRCRKAKYCSKECQSKAWSEGHRFWCSQRGETEAPSTESTAAAAPGTLGNLTGAGTAENPRTAPDGAAPGRRAFGAQHAAPGTRAAQQTAPRPAPRAGGGAPDPAFEAAGGRRAHAPPNPPINIRAPSVDHTMDVDGADPREQAVPPTPRPAPIVRAAWTPGNGPNPALGNPEDVNGVPLLAPGSATFRPPSQSRASPQSTAADMRGGESTLSRSISPAHNTTHASTSSLRQAASSGGGGGGSSQHHQSGSAFSRLTNALPRLYNFAGGHGGHGHEAHGSSGGGGGGGSGGGQDVGEHSAARRSLFRALGSGSSHGQPSRERLDRRPVVAAPPPTGRQPTQQSQHPPDSSEDADMTG